MRIDAETSYSFAIRFRSVADALDPNDDTLVSVLDPADGDRPRVMVVLDRGLTEAQPDLPQRVRSYFAAQSRTRAVDLVGPPIVLASGEAAKNSASAYEEMLDLIVQARLCRRSTVVAIGGGAFLDVVGFACATAHRGVRIVRLPTTTLSQADSGVGVKNGINRNGSKNFLGSFAPPSAVVNSAAFLRTLSDTHWRGGFSEAVKVALLKDRDLFERIERDAEAVAVRDGACAGPIIERSAELHLRHITESGDPFETLAARPLDFGHWSAHRLEELSGFALSHGDAVAIGLAIDCAYAERAGLAGRGLLERVVSVLSRLGFPLYHEAMDDTESVLQGLDAFREHLGGPLTLTLCAEPGRAVDVFDPARDRLMSDMRAAIAVVRERARAGLEAVTR